MNHWIENAFNYHVHGAAGFKTLTHLMDHCQGFEFSYSQLDEAVDVFERLADTPHPTPIGS